LLTVPNSLALSTVPPSRRLLERARPSAPVVMRQRWSDLLFLHWPVAPESIREHLPEGLSVDLYEGRAWLGLVPFRMSGVRPRFLPAAPGVSSFPEYNLRTYVIDRKGRPGVWFFSLDTPKSLANWIARTFFHLNYRRAEISVNLLPNGTIDYLSRRAGQAASDHFRWTPTGRPFEAVPGSLEFFLVERYRLFAFDRSKGRIYSGKVHHEPYAIQSAELERFGTALFGINGLAAPEGPPASVLASPGVDVRIFPLQRIGDSDPDD